jgi:adenosine kinase
MRRVGARITTCADKGVLIERSDRDPVHIWAAAVDNPADPTGVGDAFRAGFFAGLSWRLSDERSAQIGCVLAALKLKAVGTQEYNINHYDLIKKLEESYGADAGDEIASVLP